MAQKTDFNAEEWDMIDELSDEGESFEEDTFASSIFVKVDKNYDTIDLSQNSSESVKDDSFTNEQLVEAHTEQAKERKIVISRRHSGEPISAQEEDAFKKQIQDLFDLLELEKEDLKEGVRVYQTDSSPSMPWRFH